MAAFPKPLQELIDVFRTFPGVGEKNAQRYAFFLLRQSPTDLARLAEKIRELPTRIVRCATCGMVDESSPCRYDRDQTRDGSVLCVVAETTDVPVIEQSGAFKGRYHILGGVLNPLEGVTPDKLNIDALVERIRRDRVTEVIIATNPDMEGETTALHLKKLLASLANVKVTRLGRGLPMGATLEYADEVTVANALRGRQSA
ncbi:MAG: recombination protein RecR [Candidatus Kerfeldbacteria bacterium]|nr:recombination protein RecR [Candidatus Kerfeldbacteria bacterium]